MPRSRLTAASWRFEGDRLSAIREKMAVGRKTLSERYGAPLYGIKTGLNDAFIVSGETREKLAACGHSCRLRKRKGPQTRPFVGPRLRGDDERGSGPSRGINPT